MADAGHKLVIVESPAKARTIGGYLGRGYVVESSIGHIRDLPQSAADTPAKIKDKPWGRLGVDVDNGFTPVLRRAARQEGAHRQAQGPAQGRRRALPRHRRGPRGRGDRLAPARRAEAEGIPVHRMVFHEITPQAILAAVDEPARDQRRPRRGPGGAAHPRPPLRLRGLARCCGRRSCPACPPAACSRWRPGWSSTASASGWRSASRRTGTSRAPSTPAPARTPRMFPAKLHSRRRACGSPAARDFGPDGELKASGADRRPPRPRRAPRALVAGAARHVVRRPLGRVQALPPPALRAVPHHDAAAGGQPQARHDAPRATMSVAQRLYENGFITYMRTDSTTLSEHRGRRGPVAGARAVRRGVPPRRAAHLRLARSRTPRRRTRRSGPSGERFRTPAQTGLTGDAVPALRADLDAHRRLADEGRRRPLA